METTVLEIKNNEFLRQFETMFDNSLATIEYSIHPKNIFLTKMVMNEDLVEKGYDDIFMQALFNDFKENNVKMIPASIKFVSFYRKNRKHYKELLPVGISI